MLVTGWLAGCVPFDAPRPSPPSAPSDEVCGDGVDQDGDGFAPPCTLEDGAAQVWTGEGPGGWAGDALGALGAIDGPGGDWVVGAKGDGGGDGVAYLVVDPAPSGGPRSLALSRVRYRWSGQPGAALGASVAGLVSDGRHVAVAIGAPNAYGEERVGAVWIVSGAPPAGQTELDLGAALLDGADGVQQWVGSATGARAGLRVAAAGDVDDDGAPDLIVGSEASAAYLLRGPFGEGQRSLAASADWVWIGAHPDDQAGCAVAGLGDLRGEGSVTLGVGVCRSDVGGPNAGEVVLVDAGPALADHVLGADDRSVVGEVPEGRLGVTVVRAGDVDGDGLDDLVVGAHGCGIDFASSDGCASAGDGGWYGPTTWAVVPGPGPAGVATLSEAASIRVEIGASVNQASCDAAAAGRFVGGDAVDLAVGACADPQGALWLAVDPGPATGVIALPEGAPGWVRVPGAEAGALAGAELAAGEGALAVGAWKADVGGVDAGAVYLLAP